MHYGEAVQGRGSRYGWGIKRLYGKLGKGWVELFSLEGRARGGGGVLCTISG